MGKADRAAPTEIDAELAASFAAIGITVEPTVNDQDDAISVWDVSWPSFRLFLDCETQWRMTATMAGMFHTGIDYASAIALLKIRPRRLRKRAAELLADLRVMEAEALDVFEKARD